MRYVEKSNYCVFLFIDLLKKVIRGIFFRCKYSSKSFVAIGKRVKILGKKKDLIIWKRVKIEDGAFIQSVSQNSIILGDNVTICQNAVIRPSGFYGGHLGKGLIMGNNSSIGAFSYIGCSGEIKIGNNVMIGPRCTMIAENHNFNDLNEIMQKQGVTQKGIEIKDNVWLGANVVILDGVKIETGCVIAAGAVVNKSTIKNGVYAGVPAKLIKMRGE